MCQPAANLRLKYMSTIISFGHAAIGHCKGLDRRGRGLLESLLFLSSSFLLRSNRILMPNGVFGKCLTFGISCLRIELLFIKCNLNLLKHAQVIIYAGTVDL